MNDHQLDALFRSAAERFQSTPGQKEEVWKALEEKLEDASGPVSDHRNGRKVLRCLLLLLLGIAIGLYIWHRPGRVTADRTKTIVSDHYKRGEHRPTPSQTPARQRTARWRPDDPKQRPATDPAAVTHKRPAPVPEFQNDNKAPAPPMSLTSRPVPLPSLDRQFPPMTQPVPAAVFPSGIKKQAAPGNATAILADSGRGKNTTAESHAQADLPGPNRPQWYLGFVVGPEWSGLPGNNWEPGLSAGLRISYRFLPRWTLTTGLLLSRKRYAAGPTDYHPKDTSWRNANVTNIDASCVVIDIPLNISYRLWSRKHHQVFVSTGLSSYWMHAEQYLYQYKTNNGEPREWEKSLYDQNLHLFSILNFSLGYKRTFNHFNIGVSPYVKIPLNQIGYGRVRLYNAGIQVSFQYRLK